MLQNMRIGHLPSLHAWHVKTSIQQVGPSGTTSRAGRTSRHVIAHSVRKHKVGDSLTLYILFFCFLKTTAPSNNSLFLKIVPLQKLLHTLEKLTEDDLESWVADNREQVTISFLGWVAELEAAASGTEQERLWDLGSRLMALREGFAPVAAASLSQELVAASAAQQSQAQPLSTALEVAGPAPLGDAVRRNAALGLSVEGMELLEQQAAALEATMGSQRAQALTEILGRKQMKKPEEANTLLAADAAGRILEVLVQIDSREDRAAMLPEAFTPPSAPVGGRNPANGGNASVDVENEDDEEDLYTTPLQLLQAVDLWLHRAQIEGSPQDGRSVTGLLGGSALGLDVRRLLVVLNELREDILGAWDSSSGDDF